MLGSNLGRDFDFRGFTLPHRQFLEQYLDKTRQFLEQYRDKTMVASFQNPFQFISYSTIRP
jgi:hypothetical protein